MYKPKTKEQKEACDLAYPSQEGNGMPKVAKLSKMAKKMAKKK